MDLLLWLVHRPLDLHTVADEVPLGLTFLVDPFLVLCLQHPLKIFQFTHDL